MEERVQATKKNMKKCNIFYEDDIYLLRKDKSDKKTLRRNEVYTATARMSGHTTFEVILYIGDAMGDFPNDDATKFGNTQFILPNPMYGKW